MGLAQQQWCFFSCLLVASFFFNHFFLPMNAQRLHSTVAHPLVAVQTRSPLCILLVDDHALFRAGMRFILSEDVLAGSEILEAGQITEALALPVAGDAVQVVLLDVQLPGLNGVEGLSLIKKRWPKAAVLMLSAQEDTAVQQTALKRGAQAFVSKSASPEQIRAMVLRAGRGELAQAEPSGEALPSGQVQPGVPASKEEALSARQLQVLLLMCEGISNKAIARRLFVSENTVRTHVAAVLKYFASSTRLEAVMAAQRSGLVTPQTARAPTVMV
jgi:DNA-binding NarL/FixJ family response regulator